MTWILSAIFAFSLLSDMSPSPVKSAKTVKAPKASQPAAATEVTRIRSDSADYDRVSGMAMFEGHVFVEHAGEYTMNADRIYAVMTSSNEIGRVVAVGGVTITNAARVGSCAMATFRRAKREIEMFGKAGGAPARLVDGGDRPSELEGDRIKFWLDAEQVEVENSRITTSEKGGVELL